MKDDAISRQAVLGLIYTLPPEDAMVKAMLIKSVQQMESVQPVIIKTTNLQQSCNNVATDTISRRLAIDKFAAYIYHAFKDFYRIGLHRKTLTPEQCRRVARNVLAEVPSAQPERKTGRWNCSDDMYESAVCSVCGWDTTEPWDHIRHWFNFCPNCGADMRKGEQE